LDTSKEWIINTWEVSKSGAGEGWRRMEYISCTDRVRNKGLQSQEEEEYTMYNKNEGTLTGMVTFCVGTAF
jgi:uncharacterized membrane protein